MSYRSSSDSYACDAGLVIIAADAQRYRVHGGSFEAAPYLRGRFSPYPGAGRP